MPRRASLGQLLFRGRQHVSGGVDFVFSGEDVGAGDVRVGFHLIRARDPIAISTKRQWLLAGGALGQFRRAGRSEEPVAVRAC